MASRKTGSGRLVLDTGEWEAFKDEVVEELSHEAVQAREAAQAREAMEAGGARASDSSERFRAIASDVCAGKQRECATSGPLAQLTTSLRTVKREVATMTEQVSEIQSELKTAREVVGAQDRASNKRLTLFVGGFTVLGVLGNLINIVWTLVHRGH